MLRVSTQRAEAIIQSEIRAMSIECEKVQGINLAQGVCDTPLPRPVAEGAKAAIGRDCNSYTRYDGIDELRSAIAQKLCTYNRINADPETQITVTSGSTGAFYCACLALLNPGDEVILFEPYYGYHVNTLRATQAVPAYVTMQPPDWSFTPDDLQAAVTARTKAILVNTPANPSGKVFTATELEWIADFATNHDLLVFTDEIYEYFLYDSRTHISPAALPGMAERTITISGFSKTYSITGWRIGYSCCQPEWARIIGYMHDLVYVCAPSPLQWGAVAGLNELNAQFYSDLALEYRAKRNQLCHALEEIGLNPCWPQGAYYVLADVSRLPGNNSKDRAMYLLKQTGIAAVPGSAFFHGTGGENLVRLCYAKTDAELDSACERLGALR
ncbi:MAG: pyridoxal phosphate-dependent aminotransferase [Acidobacteriaceae bacterium]|nr:pyridoxal phosphate-dependent aminotransferase [Acidobacteriaceae bacterium]MBV9781835.1 pyridoxal phosphate-dependent aminotransferase [Acidobacteriaceae bacterium]